MDRHHFTPSRPNGVVCVALIALMLTPDDVQVCGYPAAHPIHEVPTPANTPAEARTGISDQTAAALDDLAAIRREVVRCINNDIIGPGYRAYLDRIERALRGAR